MKILAVSHEFPPIGGGGANACYFLTKGFVERGHQVTLVTANYMGMSEEETINGVRVIRVNAKRQHQEHCSFMEMLSYLWKALFVVDKLEKKEQFDICLVFFGIPSGPLGYVLKKKYKLPYIIRFGGGDVPGFQERFTKIYKILAPVIKTIWKNADALVANSQGLKDMALRFYDGKDFEIICNGVDTSVFYPIDKPEREEFQILFVSRLIERKGLQHIIPKLAEIQQATDKALKLVIVGDGPYRSELEKLVKQYNVQGMVCFEGQKSKTEIVPYYQHADIFVLPSEKEGMPNVVLEAMACGLPIIMTPCEGSHELIDGNGYICPVREIPAKICTLCENDQEREKFSGMSEERISRNFTWNQVVEKYINIMGSIVK